MFFFLAVIPVGKRVAESPCSRKHPDAKRPRLAGTVVSNSTVVVVSSVEAHYQALIVKEFKFSFVM